MDEHIRPFEPSDWQAVAAIYRQGLATGMATFQTSCPSYAEWDAGHYAFCRYVYLLDEHIVGWVALSPTSSRPVYAGVAEVSIYIAEEAQGRGIGTQLLRQAIAESEAQGIWTLQSAIIQQNVASIALHRTCGFREVGYRERIAQDSQGVWRNTVLMERRSQLPQFDGA